MLEQHIQADGLPPPRSSLLAEAIVGAAFRMAWRWVREGGCSSEEIALDASRMVAGTIRAMAER